MREIVRVERGPHRVDVPACAVAPPAPLHAGGRLGREVVLLGWVRVGFRVGVGVGVGGRVRVRVRLGCG